MATQALLSSSEAGRQLLWGRPLQFATSRSLGDSRKSASFVVRAASTPQSRRQTALVRVEAIPLILRWKPPRRLRVRPVGPIGPRRHRRLHRAEVAGLRRGVQREDHHDGGRRSDRARDLGQARPDPGRDRPPVVQDRGHPSGGDVQLLGRRVHVRVRDGARGLRGAQEAAGLVQPGVHGEAVLPRAGEVLGRVRRPDLSGRAHLQLAGVREGREVDEGVEGEGGEEWEVGHVGHLGLLHSGPGHRGWPVPEPLGSLG